MARMERLPDGCNHRARIASVEVRAKQVGMTYVYQGHIEKVPILEEIMQRGGFAWTRSRT